MSKFLEIIWLKIDHVPALGMYTLLLIVNPFRQSTYVDCTESIISHEG